MNLVVEILKNIVSTLVSIGVVGVIAYSMRESIKRLIDHHFKLKEVGVQHKHEMEAEIRKNSIPMYLELGEIIYNLRSHAKQISLSQTPLGESKDRYIENCDLLRDRIGRYRALLDDELYEQIHQYKRENQEFLLFIDISTRNEELRKNKAMFSQEIKDALVCKYSTIEAMNGDITMKMQSNLGMRNVAND